MIDLAPNNKQGLPLSSPLMPAAGFFGFGCEYADLVDVAGMGAFVTGPITLRPRPASPPPRVAEVPGGLVLSRGTPNPGVRQVIQRHAAFWRHLGRPVIAHLPADRPAELTRTAGALESTGAVAGLELGLPQVALDDVVPLVRAVRRCELPMLARLPFQCTLDMAMACQDLGVDALVVAGPPAAIAATASGRLVSGVWLGPALQPLTVALLAAYRRMVDLPLVACGGVHDESGARLLLEQGACAVQIDSLVFVDPAAVNRLVRALAHPSRG